MREYNTHRGKLKYLVSNLDYLYRLTYRKVRGKRLLRSKIGNKSILESNSTGSFIKEKINGQKPFMAGRLGSIELSAVDHVYRKKIGVSKQLPDRMKHMLCNNAGFFPNDDNFITQFEEIMLEALKVVDLFACFHDNELYYAKYCTPPNVQFCQLKDIEPSLGSPDSWLSALKGKKVLVIHPYEKSIQTQYSRRKEIFPNGFLPEFELKTIKAVQTIAGTKDDRFETWFDALEWMERQMDAIDFDIALIGCGAYGFPLAAYAKKIGKQAIHIGGATQLIFGIIGSRWEEKEYVKKCVNQYWIRPLPEETPAEAKTIEQGCYW